VFVGDNEKQVLQAATHAARHGFSRTATLTGGVQALEGTPVQQASCKSWLAATQLGPRHVANLANVLQAEQTFINRDAVAAVLGHVDVGCPPQQAVVLDIRRHDERAMYGSIPGVSNSPLFASCLCCLALQTCNPVLCASWHNYKSMAPPNTDRICDAAGLSRGCSPTCISATHGIPDGTRGLGRVLSFSAASK